MQNLHEEKLETGRPRDAMFCLGIRAAHVHSRLVATGRRGRRPCCAWAEEGENKVCTTHAEHRQSQEGRTCRHLLQRRGL